jgi:hypothetical protein
MAELTRRDLFKTAGAAAAAIGVASLQGPAPGLFSSPAQAQAHARTAPPGCGIRTASVTAEGRQR